MSYFSQANEYDMNKHACKDSIFEPAEIFVINSNKIWILGIFYNALLQKGWYCQVLWVYLVIRIPTKFILYFYEISTIFYNFLEIEMNFWFLWKRKSKRKMVPVTEPEATHGLAIPGTVTCGAWQATRPSGSRHCGLAHGRKRPGRPLSAAPRCAPGAWSSQARPALWRGRRWLHGVRKVERSPAGAPSRNEILVGQP
jgi:hypothetical protein